MLVYKKNSVYLIFFKQLSNVSKNGEFWNFKPKPPFFYLFLYSLKKKEMLVWSTVHIMFIVNGAITDRHEKNKDT